ncbi:MAG: hypothetical protein GX610_06215 [Rhodococcus sp.]|nr:hypothetical protein [Rhodococcus sp. (in: high G+C Gram-positive bacteria)]
MGVVITSTGTSNATDTASVVTHAARAARSAMDAAGVTPSQIGVLINTCVYRDSNTMEPAVAALVQKEAGIGLEYADGDPLSFSFDLMNGACGVLNAVQVASSLLATKSTDHVLVVSGDTHPSMSGADAPADFPYGTTGAAFLLEHTENQDGFGRVHTELGEGTVAVAGYVDADSIGSNGRNLVTVERDDDFTERLLDVALPPARSALADGEVDLSSTVLVASTPEPDFPAKLAAELGVSATEPALLGEFDRDPHTATLTLTYHEAARRGAFGQYRNILFVTAGAGPSAAAVLYRIPSPGNEAPDNEPNA